MPKTFHRFFTLGLSICVTTMKQWWWMEHWFVVNKARFFSTYWHEDDPLFTRQTWCGFKVVLSVLSTVIYQKITIWHPLALPLCTLSQRKSGVGTYLFVEYWLHTWGFRSCIAGSVICQEILDFFLQVIFFLYYVLYRNLNNNIYRGNLEWQNIWETFWKGQPFCTEHEMNCVIQSTNSL
jgi:hypothetical protein